MPTQQMRSWLRSRRLLVVCASMAWLGVLVALGIVLAGSQAGARRAVAQRLAARTSGGSEFAALYVQDILSRERKQADVWLAGRRPTLEDVTHASVAMGVPASVLVDRSGAVLQVLPAKPALLGTVITGKYPHLAAAVHGRAAISNVVPSAARGVPVVGFAEPFATPWGRRVFSGAFSVSETPLGAYMSHVIVTPGRHVYLVDASGSLIASSEALNDAHPTLGQIDPRLAASVKTRSTGGYGAPGGARTFVSTPVPGTPWRLVVTVPDAQLYVSVDGASKWLAWLAVAGLALAGLIIIAIGSRLLRSRERLAALNRELDGLSRVDSLTGLANRRDLEETLAAALSTGRRRLSDVSVLLIDIDHFKHVNDSQGHQAGDAVLIATGQSIQASLRAEDTVGRWGGEEFLAVLPDTDADGAVFVAERIRSQVANPGRGDTDPRSAITVTIGVAAWASGGIDDLISRADAALYAGKAQGRNNVQRAPAAQPAGHRGHARLDPAVIP